MSVRSFRTSTSGTASEAGRTEAMSLARPRNDQEIEDRFVDFMVMPLYALEAHHTHTRKDKSRSRFSERTA